MTLDLRLLVYSTILTWVMIMFAASAKGRLWTVPGMIYGMGNRDKPAQDPTALAARADRAAKNMLENMVLFVALLLAARTAGVASEKLILPAQLFFYARLAYWPIYVLGLPFVRTAVWGVGVIGMGMIAATMFSL